MELRGLVEEEDALMRQADLAGPEPPPPADHAFERGGMVGGAEGRPKLQGGARPEDARQRIERGDLHGIFLAEIRQEPDEAPGGHSLARAGRPEQEDVVPARGRDLEGPPEARLSLQLRKVALRRPRPTGSRGIPSAQFAAVGPKRWRRLAALADEAEERGRFCEAPESERRVPCAGPSPRRHFPRGR